MASNSATPFWQSKGFTRICTGGNCYAWEKTFKQQGWHPVQVLITSNEDQETKSASEMHNVGLYLYGQGEHYAFEYFPDATHAWNWIKEKLAIPT